MSRLDARPSVSNRRYDRALDGRTLHRRHRRTMATMTSSHAGGAEKDFDAGVSIASLPWGDEKAHSDAVTTTIETMVQRDGHGKRTSFIARPVNRELARGVVLVLHTAIGPWETFATSCCEALASNGYDAVAPDLYGLGECVFDKETQREIRGGMENRAAFGARGALEALREYRASAGGVVPERYAAVGFCLGGQVALDLARGLAPFDVSVGEIAGVASFHGVLDAPDLDGEAARACEVEIYHGDADPFTTSHALDACLRDLEGRGIVGNTKVLRFEGVKHAFTRPEKTKASDHEAGFGYDEKAAAESWKSCEAMLQRLFA